VKVYRDCFGMGSCCIDANIQPLKPKLFRERWAPADGWDLFRLVCVCTVRNT